MKPIQKHILTTLCGIALTASPALASDTLANGEIAVVFFQVISNVVQPTTYVFNLGPGSAFRDNTQNNVAVTAINATISNSNIGADLNAIFSPSGTPWYDLGTVRWAVVGGVPQPGAAPLINGDPNRTTYYSRSRSSFTSGSFGPNASNAFTISQTNRGTVANNIEGFFNGTNNGINNISPSTSVTGANASGVLLPITNLQSFHLYVPPTSTTQFGISQSPTQTLNANALTGGAGIEGALDLFRFIDTVTGATLTAGASAGNAVVGSSQYVGTLTIDSSGNLKIQGVGVANPDSDNDGMLDTWEMTYFLNLSQTAAGDFEGDGTNNLTEFRLGLIPNSGSSFFATTRSATTGQLTWPSVTGVTFKVYRSIALASWEVIDTVAGTAGTATYTDATPPVGKAFYRIGLQP